MIKIRTFLILILSLALVPLVAFSVVGYAQNLESRQQIILDRNLEIANMVALGFRAFILQAVQTEEAGGLAIWQGGFSPAQARTFLKELKARNPQLTDVFYAHPDGRIITGTSSHENPVPADTLRRIKDGASWAASSLHPSGRGDRVEFHVTSAIRVNGKVRALVSGVISDRTVFDFIKIKIGRRGNIGIIDNKGRAAALSFKAELSWSQRGRRFISSIRSALDGKPAVTKGFHDPLGNVERMGASVPIKPIGWVANVFQPVNEVLAPVRQEAQIQAALSLSVSFVALAVVLILSRAITMPISELASETDYFRRGKYDRRVPETARITEISALAKALNSAAAETQHRFEVEQHIADVLQGALLPMEAPVLPGFLVGTRYASATEQALVGGDFYDFITLGPTRAGIVVGDVQGKGVEAAVTTVTTKFALRDLAARHDSPAEVVKILNRICLRELPTDQFITLVYMILDLATGVIEYASAGHHPPIICGPTGCRDLTENGAALGIMEGADYQTGVATIALNETLFLYTDGVIEARTGSDLFGSERLHSLLFENVGLGPQSLCELIYKACVDFGDNALKDDIAMVVIRRGA